MKSSSTSSSSASPRRARLRVAATALAALAVLAAARLFLWYASEALFLIPENDFDKLYLMNETRYRLSEERTPKVIVMGTSRLGVLSPECMAAELGHDPSEVVNYSLAGNSFWRILAFFRRNPAILERAEVVVIDLLPYQLFRGPLFTEEDELFLRLATLEERRAVSHPARRLKALADRVYPAWSERHNPAQWRVGLRLVAMSPEDRYRAFQEAVRQGGDAIALRREEHEAPVAANPELGRGYAPPPEVSAVQVLALEELRAVLPEGCVLVLAWLPVRPDFAAALMDDEEMGPSYRAFKEHMTGVGGDGVVDVWLDNLDGRYFGEMDFTDVVHFSPSGSAKVCSLLGEAIRGGPNRRPAPVPQAPAAPGSETAPPG